MKKKEKSLFTYSLREFPALCLATVFVGLWELSRLPDRLRGKIEKPRPKASVKKQAELEDEIFG